MISQVGRGCAFAPCTLLPTRADHVVSAVLMCSKIRLQNPTANIITVTVSIREHIHEETQINFTLPLFLTNFFSGEIILVLDTLLCIQ